MPIRWKLAIVLNDMGLTPYRLAKLTGLSVPTCYDLVKPHVPGRIDAHTLALLCDALKVQPGDLLEYRKRWPRTLLEYLPDE